jgi:hypothetical protein
MFQFNVAKEAFVLHSKLVSRHSPALHALMCGHMMEAEEKQTFISDVDKDTFARFAEFIYGGDYNVAEALIVLDDLDTERRRSESDSPRPLEIDVEEIPDPPSPEDAADPPPLDENDWSPPRNSKKKRKRGIQIPVRNRLPPFADFSLPAVDNVSFPEIHDHEAVSDTGLMYDYAEALCHVQLYVFAEKYQTLRHMPLITWLWLIKAGWHRGLGFMHAVNGATRNFQGQKHRKGGTRPVRSYDS